MKKIQNYISVLGASLLLFGCTKDLETVTYNPADATPAVLEELASTYVLTADEQNDVAIDFKWAEAQFGFNASVTNNLQMDVAGNDFAGATTLTSMSLGGAYTMTHGELNNSIMKLLDSYSMELAAADFEFRVVSSFSDGVEPLYSNVVSANVTPYAGTKQYPLIAVIGDYSGWNFENSQKLYSADEGTLYTAMVAFDGKSANGWKISEFTGWQGGNWGVGAEEFTAEQSPVTLFNDGGSGNLSIYAKDFYRLSFDTATAELTVLASYDTWGVVGQHNGWGETPDVPLTLGSETDANGLTTFFLTATVDLKAGEGWKLRPDNTWGADRGPGSFPGGEPSGADGNFAVDADGTYAIRWYFNQVEESLMAVQLASATPAELASPEASYTLSQDTEAETAMTLTWAAADLGTSEPIAYAVEMDVVGKEFAGVVTLGSVTDATEFSITQGELNVALVNLMKSYEMEIEPVDVEFRVYSSSTDPATKPVYSNVVTTNVTPYVEKLAGDDAAIDELPAPDNSAYSSIALRGDYNGWSFDAAERLFSAENDDNYAAMIYLDGKGANGWKLCADADWVENWGMPSADEEAEAASMTLVVGGENFNIYTNNSYKVTFNKATGEFAVSNPHASWGVVGAHNGWGGSEDAAMALACRDNVYYLHATIKFDAGAEWKIRPDAAWGEDFGCYAVTVADEFKTAEDNGNFTIPEAGVYTIRWYFNSVNQEVRVIKHVE